MLLGLITIIAVLLTSVWTIARDVGNRIISGGIFIAIFMPYEIFSISFTDFSLSKISPFSVYCVSVFLLYIFRSILLHKTLNLDRYMLAGLAFILFVAGTTYYNLGGKGFGTFIDNYLSPFLALILVVNERSRLRAKLNDIYLLIICIAALYGILESILKQNLLYGFVFSQMGWIDTQWSSTFHRSTSTIGHPLIAATVYVMTLAFMDKQQKNYWFYFTIISLGVLSTASRTAIVLVVFTLLAKHIRFQQSKRSIVAISLISALSILGFLVGVFDQIINRFVNGEGSNTVRVQLIDYIPEFFKISMWGYGVGSSGDVALNIGFYNVIEVAWIALLIELGIWGLMASFLVSSLIIKNYKLREGRNLFLLTLFLMISSYNSISVHTPLIFLAILILFIPKPQRLERKNGTVFRNNIHTTKIQVPFRSSTGRNGAIKGA